MKSASNSKKNELNQTFPKSKSTQKQKQPEIKQLSSSLRKSHDRDQSSSKKSVKFLEEERPEKEKKLQESIIITDSIDDPKSKIFVVNRSSIDSKQYKTNNFYQNDDEEEKKSLSRIVSDPKLRIIAPGLDWSDSNHKSEKRVRQKSMDVASIPTKKPHHTRHSSTSKPEPKPQESNNIKIEEPKKSPANDENTDDHLSEQSIRSSRFEESNELLKSIYEFNKQSRSQ